MLSWRAKAVLHPGGALNGRLNLSGTGVESSAVEGNKSNSKAIQGVTTEDTPPPLWSPGSWWRGVDADPIVANCRSPLENFNRLLACGGTACLSLVGDGDGGTVRSAPQAREAPPRAAPPELPAVPDREEEDGPASARFGSVRTSATFPPATSDERKRVAARAGRVAREAVERAREQAKQEAKDEAERRVEETKAEALREVEKAREKAEMRINACTEEMKWMEANLNYENKQNSNLNTDLAQLKQGIITAKVQMKKDLSAARNEAQRTVEERNAEIKKLEQAIATLKADADKDQKLREEVMSLAQTDAQKEVISRTKEIQKMDDVIATLRTNIESERRFREEAERIVREKTLEMEESAHAQSKILRNMEANLKAGNLQNMALHSEIANLKTEILAAKATQQAMDDANANLTKEAETAKKAAESKIKEQTRALKEMEAKMKNESKQNANLNAQIAKLKKDIGDAWAKQDKLDEKAQQVKNQAELKIVDQTEALKKVEAKLRSENKQNSVLDARIEQLNKSIITARAKQEALDEEARRAKEQAEVRISAQTKALKEMETNWKSESKQNVALVAQIAQLKKDIAAAKEGDRSVRSADKAQRAKEAAEAKISKQERALKEMEANWTAETERNKALNQQIDQMKKGLVAEANQSMARSTSDTGRAREQAETLKKMQANWKTEIKTSSALNDQVAQLKFDNIKLKRDMSIDRSEKQKIIDAQTEELRKVERSIDRLKANISQKYKLRDDALESMSGGESVDLQKKIDSLSDEIMHEQKKYIDKLKVLQSVSRSMSLDSTCSKSIYYGGHKVEVDEEESSVVEEEEEAEESDEDEGAEETDVIHDDDDDDGEDEDDEGRDDEEASNYVDFDASTFASASTASAHGGGKKKGWFRKLLPANHSDGDSLASTIASQRSGVATTTARKKKWMRPNKWMRRSGDSRGSSGRWNLQNDVLSEDSREWDDEEEEEEDDTLGDVETLEDADTRESRSYTVSYSESNADTFESVREVESDCTSEGGESALSETESMRTGTETLQSETETVRSASEKVRQSANESGSEKSSTKRAAEDTGASDEEEEGEGAEVGMERSKSDDSSDSAALEVQKTASAGSEQTDCTSTCGFFPDDEDVESASGTLSTATGSTAVEPSTKKEESVVRGSMASWFGFASTQEAITERVNSGNTILVQ